LKKKIKRELKSILARKLREKPWKWMLEGRFREEKRSEVKGKTCFLTKSFMKLWLRGKEP
jgi:hypothetical protein